MKIYTLDLNFSMPGVIASYLIDTGSEPVLIETGPDSVFSELENKLKKHNLTLRDIRRVFISHIHLDHAGACWRFAEHGADIYVHPSGARHMIDPSRLLASARMIYRNDMERLWGNVNPIAKERIIPVPDGSVFKMGDTEIRVYETKGHASHHNIFLIGDSLFSGDTGGIKIKDGPVIPPTPPPDINIEDWRESINRMREMKPDFIYPTHFGAHGDVTAYLDELEERLMKFADWGLNMVKTGFSDEEIGRQCDAMIRGILKESGASEDLIMAYELADPFWMNAGGLIRYWRKKGVSG